LLSLANAVLSRCEIRYNLVQRLPKTPEIEFKGHVFEVSRNALLSRLEIPELGKINVYNTHLCADCEDFERVEQIKVVLEFLKSLEENTGDDYPTILGGDLNFDRFRDHGKQKFQYESIINSGFIDSYAEYIIAVSGGRETLDTLCEDEDNPDEHCTVGVSELNGPKSRRKDYVFSRGFADVLLSRVVFNTLVNPEEPTVSDHAGVFVRLGLP
jgi:maltose 6'-phosphate phosphatase